MHMPSNLDTETWYADPVLKHVDGIPAYLLKVDIRMRLQQLAYIMYIM